MGSIVLDLDTVRNETLEIREAAISPMRQRGVVWSWKYPHADAWGWTVAFICIGDSARTNAWATKAL